MARHFCTSLIKASAALLLAATACHAAAAELAGRARFPDPQLPPPWIEVHPAALRDFELGRTVFNTEWTAAGLGSTGANQGLGPLFVQPSCNACHAGGGRGQPGAAGELSASFVMQLDGPATAYGHVLNTRAIEGHVPEGSISVSLHERSGRYPDGTRWKLQEPRYAITAPASGALPSRTVLKPRIAPAVFGAGLLDAVPQDALEAIREQQAPRLKGSAAGRFGWQGSAMSLVDQTAIAFSREMGLTSDMRPADDCTAAQQSCLQAQHGGAPEVPERLFHALNSFQFLLAAPLRSGIDAGVDVAGAALFERVGCAACHVPTLPVPREGAESIRIDPYTDLLLHDLGAGLADRTVAGRRVQSRWRTAPLWGMAHALASGPVALLHDGRARSIEEAILWHEGEASESRRGFMALDAAARNQLLEWVGSL